MNCFDICPRFRRRTHSYTRPVDWHAMEKRLNRWLVRQFLPPRSYAWPAREAIEAATVAVVWFGLVVVVRWERIERPVVDCSFDGGHVLAERITVDVMRACASHQFLGHIVEGELFGLCAVLCRLVSFKLRRRFRTHGYLPWLVRSPLPRYLSSAVNSDFPRGVFFSTIPDKELVIKLPIPWKEYTRIAGK